MTTLCVIPARFASQRLPGKPLKSIKGIPLVMWAFNSARAADVFAEVVVAADDRRICDAVSFHGGRAVMTSAAHASGTDRVNEAAQSSSCTHVVNLQGDEPQVPAALLAAFCARLKTIDDNTLLTCVTNATIEESCNPNVVKAVLDIQGYALYFSRAQIPCDRNGATGLPVLKHIGLYGFSRGGLARFCALPCGELEQREKLEQLRALEHGMRIACIKTEYSGAGIDTPADLAQFRARVGAAEID
jgi:3-deoxy-manno-octulosonate cytidylyltransferase (CMP-KDO synthetase)